MGSFHFPAMRILIAVGVLRVMMKGERIAGGVNSLDRMALMWAAWNVFSVIFHKSDVLVFRLGILYDVIGTYWLLRVFIQKSRRYSDRLQDGMHPALAFVCNNVGRETTWDQSSQLG